MLEVTYCLYGVSLRGDWKFIRETLNLDRHYNTNNICWICSACKQSSDHGLLYTNFKNDCAWRQTCFLSEPWKTASVLTELTGFSLKMVRIDLLHVFYLGVCRDLLGSALRLLTSRRGFFAGNNMDERLKLASKLLKKYCKKTKKSVRFKVFSRNRLNIKAKTYPELMCKGSDTAVVLSWLSSLLESICLPDEYDQLALLIWLANSFCKVLAHGDYFLPRADREEAASSLHAFLNLYLSFAKEAYETNKWIWRVRPKFHMLCHLQIELEKDVDLSLNPKAYSTWMDEDMVKNIMRIKTKTHKKTSTLRTLQRYVGGLKLRLLSLG